MGVFRKTANGVHSALSWATKKVRDTRMGGYAYKAGIWSVIDPIEISKLDFLIARKACAYGLPMIGGVEVLLAIAKSSHWWDTIFHGLGSNLLIGAGMHFGWLLWCAAVEKDFHPGKALEEFRQNMVRTGWRALFWSIGGKFLIATALKPVLVFVGSSLLHLLPVLAYLAPLKPFLISMASAAFIGAPHVAVPIAISAIVIIGVLGGVVPLLFPQLKEAGSFKEVCDSFRLCNLAEGAKKILNLLASPSQSFSIRDPLSSLWSSTQFFMEELLKWLGVDSDELVEAIKGFVSDGFKGSVNFAGLAAKATWNAGKHIVGYEWRQIVDENAAPIDVQPMPQPEGPRQFVGPPANIEVRQQRNEEKEVFMAWTQALQNGIFQEAYPQAPLRLVDIPADDEEVYPIAPTHSVHILENDFNVASSRLAQPIAA